jgi:hypothetical protein
MKFFSVYHQCFNNKKATEFAIANFRNHNPNVPYYLLSDGGLDFSEIAKKYNCHFVMASENIGTNYLEKNNAKIYLNRLRSAFEYSGTQYMVTMEDDVLCRAELIIENDFNIAMSYVPGNKLRPHIFEKTISKYNITPNVDWYGATGGTILNKNIFFDSEKIKLVDQFMEEDFEPTLGSIDQFIVMLYLICGLECAVNNGLGETHRTPNWQNSDLALVHNFKEMY